MGRPACILIHPTYTIHAGGRIWRFEAPPHCSVFVIGLDGDPVKSPGPRSLFWRAVELWFKQGSRLDAAGVCVWDDEPPPRPIRWEWVDGKRMLLPQAGD